MRKHWQEAQKEQATVFKNVFKCMHFKTNILK